MNLTAFLVFASLNILPADLPFDSVVTAAEVYPDGVPGDPRPTLYLYAPGVDCHQAPQRQQGTHVAYINNVKLEVNGFTYLSRGHSWFIFGSVTCTAVTDSRQPERSR